MRSQIKIAVGIALVSSILFSAQAQINLLSNNITFRSAGTAANTTTHYGDLKLFGPVGDLGWGWLYANAINCYGFMEINGQVSAYNNVTIQGSLNVIGTKNFIQAHPTDSTKVIRYIAIESGEALTLARGTASTLNGSVDILLPEHFALVTSDSVPVTVLTTPEKVPALLFVEERSRNSIKISMKSADFQEYGDVLFSYQVTGVREGFENQEVIIDADKINEDTKAKLSENGRKIREKGERNFAKLAKDKNVKKDR